MIYIIRVSQNRVLVKCNLLVIGDLKTAVPVGGRTARRWRGPKCPALSGELVQRVSRRTGEFIMRLISRAELKDRLDRRSDLKLVFALGEWQYRAKHIPGSLNIPCPPRLFASKEALRGLERDGEIVVYCSNELCVASIPAYYFLVKRGFRNVSRYAGGLLDWQDAGYPLDGELE